MNILKQYGKLHESSSSNGLSEFLHNIDMLKEKNSESEYENSTTKKTNSVKILTIHKSKGLEFPIVIIPFTTKLFNLQDYNQPILISSKFKLALKNSNKKTLTRTNTLQFNAAIFSEKNLMKEEELRLLYVATTRTKEKLILTAVDKNQQYKLQIEDQNETFSRAHCLSKNNYYEWILSGFLRHKNSYFLNKKIDFKLDDYDCNILIKTKFENFKFEKEGPTHKENNKLLEKLKNKIETTKINHTPTQIPAKLSVTEISKLGESNLSLRTPNFTTKTGTTEIGIATHTFLQFANFENAENNIENEIENLLKNEFITEKQRNLLDIKTLQNFFNSKTYKIIKNADKIEREKSFLFQIPAKKLFEEAPPNSKTIIQGIVDCIVEKDKKLFIIDYKTDKTSKTNLIKLYKKQLHYYKKAIENLKNKPINSCIIYSLYLNSTITFDF